MVVRLAFAIMTEVKADILVIDEALAVGDAIFTKKCMRYIKKFKKKGTILFVSHDTSAVLSLCDRAILLEEGIKKADGKTKEIIDMYIEKLHDKMKNTKGRQGNKIKERKESKVYNYDDGNTDRDKWKDYRGELLDSIKERKYIEIMKNFDGNDCKISENKKAIIDSVTIENVNDANKYKCVRSIKGGEIVKLSITGKIMSEIDNIIMGFILKNDKGLTLLGDNSYNAFTYDGRITARKDEILTCDFIFTIPLLPSGEYTITASIADGSPENHEILDWKNDALVLQSQCNSIAAGLAGVPMHNIRITRNNEEDE